MINIKFGTDGWRALIAKEFTVENVTRVAYATSLWLKEQKTQASVVVGNDPRFAGKMFSETVAQIFANAGIKVYLASNDFVSTPMVSLGTVLLKADLGVIITASHNPPEYSGYKIKASYGGPATPDLIDQVENMIPDRITLDLKSIEEYKQAGLIEFVNLEDMYVKHVEEKFDMEAIRNSGMNFAYDAMYGAGQNAMRRLFPDISFLHAEYNPGFDGQAPEPIHKNLTELSDLIKLSDGEIDSGLATDGDADRIGLYNSEGEFIDSHHIILLLIHYLVKYKNIKGDVITTFSCTQKIADLCKLYELPHTITKIGFKYICDLMVNSGREFIAGGEESGGIAITGYIPERDGIWIGLTIWEFMAKTGKSLNELIYEVYDEVGSFAVERYDLHLTENKKQEIIKSCKSNTYSKFDSYAVERIEDMDGYKFHLGDDRWVMIRPSGTEPVLRVYAEAATSVDAFKILDAAKATLLA
ncbi:phosphohexomutase domain-containing protein [Solitalea koreensis]|uniref:Phosphomannomutase n=1 Tax=Solitalea koreensis TaxID=543615 RepID=A0A521BLF0_9SPHI|nr:phosphoglucomutase/phosphomannomutase family protein [Solitalea koreensis]SMO47922.1 Phosphomannomutase [Solitalea koreensis]